MTVIDDFRGEFAFLSNFAYTTILWRGRIYTTNEHFYQAHKAKHMPDHERIRAAATPGEAKTMGSPKMLSRAALVPRWDDDKDAVMWQGLFLKFTQHPELMQRLFMLNGHTLIEGNVWHDNYWGDCKCPKCEKIDGRNQLGVMLMGLQVGLQAMGVEVLRMNRKAAQA